MGWGWGWELVCKREWLGRLCVSALVSGLGDGFVLRCSHQASGDKTERLTAATS